MECFRCRVSEDRVRLLDVISFSGIVKICKECSSEEHFPIMKKPVYSESEKVEKRQSVREMLSRISGVYIEKKPEEDAGSLELRKQETNLKEIADRNFQKNIQERRIPTNYLIDNFHWIIMRIRRSRKMSQKELALAIDGPEAAIRMVEQGVISDSMLIIKIENYFGIRLRKDDGDLLMQDVKHNVQEELFPSFRKPMQTEDVFLEKSKLEASFDPINSRNLTIADLKEIKRRRGTEIFREDDREMEKKFEEMDKRMEGNLSDEDINDLIFGKE